MWNQPRITLVLVSMMQINLLFTKQRYARKLVHFIPSDFWPSDLIFALAVTCVQVDVTSKLEVSMAFWFRVNRRQWVGQTRQTDGVQHLMQYPRKDHNKTSSGIKMMTQKISEFNARECKKTSERHLLEQSQSLFPRPNFVRLTKAQRPTRHITDHTRYDIFTGMITNQNWPMTSDASPDQLCDPLVDTATSCDPYNRQISS